MKRVLTLVMMLLGTVISYGFMLEEVDFNQRMDGKDGGYREYKLFNNGLERVRYRINLLKGGKNDASKFITVYPKVVTIEPQSRATFKVFAKAPETAKKGLYSFNLEFKPIGIPVLSKANGGKVSGSATINIAPVVEMYGYVGEVNFQEDLKVHNLKIEKSKDKGVDITGIITNMSYAVTELGMIVYGEEDYLLGSKDIGRIGSYERSKKFKINLKELGSARKVKKLALYRSVNGEIEILKKISLYNENIQ